MRWDTLSGATLSSCEWVPSDAEADIAMQSEGSLVDWAAVPSDMFQCSVNAEFEGLTPLERAMGHALSPTSQQRHKLESSAFECAQGASRDDERRHHQRAAAADRRKLLLDDLRACVFRGVFNWGSLPPTLWAHRGRSVQNSKPSRSWRRLGDTHCDLRRVATPVASSTLLKYGTDRNLEVMETPLTGC